MPRVTAALFLTQESDEFPAAATAGARGARLGAGVGWLPVAA